MRTIALAAVAAFTLMACATAPVETQVQQPQVQRTLPQWWVAHVDFMSRNGGTWVAPNPGNDDDPSQPDAFAMEWRATNNNHLLIGRLYGIEAGVEVAEYWTYREFWHPGEQRALIEQWGGAGTYGVGESRWDPDADAGVLDQTFWLPDGRHWREGHRNQEQGDVYVTNSFDITADGEWALSSSFTWRRVNSSPQ